MQVTIPADLNGDKKVDAEERAMYLEFKRKELEDADAMRDAQRKMTWFALAGMLLYPAVVMATEIFDLTSSGNNSRRYGSSILCFCCWYRSSVLRSTSMEWKKVNGF